VTLTTPAPA